MASPQPSRRRLIIALAVVVAAVVVGGGGILLALRLAPTAQEALPTQSAEPMPSIRVTADPTPTGPPANTTEYDLTGLPSVDVFAVIPALPLDDDPQGATTGIVATPAVAAVPVFADPAAAAPVARLSAQQAYGGAVVPVVQRYADWVKVLLVGRESVPPNGSAAQISGWLRMADVSLSPQDTRIEVSLSARTIDIVSPSGSERVATDFAWGAPDTPTPVGRAFVMMTRAAPELSYTRGHPLVYLSVQSPTLSGFGGADAAVTAFHYHDDRDGNISNGCIRVSADVIERLAQLPEGTVVDIRA